MTDPLVGDFGIRTELLRRLSARSRTLEELAAVTRERYRIGTDPEEGAVAVASVTPSFLPMLRARPVLGRGFTTDDGLPGAPSVMMIGYPVWQLRYAGARDIVGRVVTVNGVARTIVGVLPDRFDIPTSHDDTLLIARNGRVAGIVRQTA